MGRSLSPTPDAELAYHEGFACVREIAGLVELATPDRRPKVLRIAILAGLRRAEREP